MSASSARLETRLEKLPSSTSGSRIGPASVFTWTLYSLCLVLCLRSYVQI